MDIKTLGERIRQRRKSLNVNQPTLALLAGIGLNTLVSLEKGTGNPKIETVMAVLDTLGMKLEIVGK